MKIEIGEKFLDYQNDIKHLDELVIKSEGEWRDSTLYKREDGTPQKIFIINMALPDGRVRSTSLSWSNLKLLVQYFGDESKNWIGKEVRAWKTKSEKAKNGFVFFFAPSFLRRDETGEWVDTRTERETTPRQTLEKTEASSVEEDYIADIPF